MSIIVEQQEPVSVVGLIVAIIALTIGEERPASAKRQMTALTVRFVYTI